jgi:hypothetical protein
MATVGVAVTERDAAVAVPPMTIASASEIAKAAGAARRVC